jgi:NitT/TauT family transport system substrate-binding protein
VKNNTKEEIMRSSRGLLFRCVIGAAASIIHVGATANAQELKNINFMGANDKSCVNYAQFGMTAFGYLEKEGYKVTLLNSDTTVPYIAFLANGDADLVMLDANETLVARETGNDIKIVYEAYQRAPEGIVVLEDSPIQSLADLKGKTIGLAEQPDEVTTQIALDSVGLKLEDVTSFVVGNQGPVMAMALRDKKIDAFAGGQGDRRAIEAQGVRFRNITPDAISNNPGNSFAVWGPTIEEKRPLITAFLKAWAEAQHAGVLDTKAVLAMCREAVPEQFEDINLGAKIINGEAYGYQLRRTVNYGELSTDVWKSIQPGFIKAGILKAEIDPATFLDTSFQDTAFDFTTQDVLDGIKKWKDANPDKVLP